MKPVTFTQFLFPDGKRTIITIEREETIAKKAELLKAIGFSFEIENKDETIWMTIINHETEKYVDSWCINGSEVSKFVDDLIMRAFDKFVRRD